MLLLQAENIKKIYGERIVLDVEELKIYTGDRIGVIGANGAGKSTLFALLAGELEPEAGWIKRFGRISYCRQFGEHGREAFYGEEALYERGALNGEAFHGREVFPEKEVCLQDQVFPEERISSGEYKIWQAPERNEDAVSGGELMRRKLAEVFSTRGHILLLDEPTANLDREGIRMLTEKMQRVETFLCISHDRQLLDQVCTSI
ncbi:MAG: ATP-binding cassette domain-containing protein, partial [Lachnospiraceae bacterium]|nr:ATP-binding cassette domain-containing protein [Lachnospiraceae bacterium]